MVLLVALMCSPLVIEVCSEVQPDVVVRPGSGVGQDDPLSPALFSVLTLALFYAIKRLHCQVEVLLYVDDILLMIRGSGSRARAVVRAVMYELSVHGYFSGLRINHQKTYALVKDSTGRAPKTVAGIEVRKSLRYLGVQLGHLTVEHAYGTIIAKMLLRARYISTLPLTLGEKASVLKIWAAPCVYLTAKVYYPSSSVVQQLNAIQSVALGLNNWGLTQDILAQPAAMGGIALPPLGSYTLWIHSQGFVQHVRGTTPGGVRSEDQFEEWARSVGLVLTPDMLPYIRLAPRTCQPPGHLGTSCTAHSRLLRLFAAPPPPPCGREAQLGVWHSSLFTDPRGRSAAPPKLVHCGFASWREVFSDGYLRMYVSQQLKLHWRVVLASAGSAVHFV